MAKQAKVTIPKPTQAERDLQDINVQLARQQLEATQLANEFTREQFEAARPVFERLSREQAVLDELFSPEEQARFSREQFDIQQELQGLALEDIRRGGAASPEQIALIQDAADKAIAQGESDIQRFQGIGLRQIGEELAPSLGLRPTDTPVLARGGQVLEEGARQQGQLVRGIRQGQANAQLNFPLGASELLSSQISSQQALAGAAAQFQSQLQNQAFNNRLRLGSRLQTGGFGAASMGLGGAPSALHALQAPRLAQMTTRTSSPMQTLQTLGAGLDVFQQGAGILGGLFGGFG